MDPESVRSGLLREMLPLPFDVCPDCERLVTFFLKPEDITEIEVFNDIGDITVIEAVTTTAGNQIHQGRHGHHGHYSYQGHLTNIITVIVTTDLTLL